MFARIVVPMLAGQYIEQNTVWTGEHLRLRLIDMAWDIHWNVLTGSGVLLVSHLMGTWDFYPGGKVAVTWSWLLPSI